MSNCSGGDGGDKKNSANNPGLQTNFEAASSEAETAVGYFKNPQTILIGESDNAPKVYIRSRPETIVGVDDYSEVMLRVGLVSQREMEAHRGKAIEDIEIEAERSVLTGVAGSGAFASLVTDFTADFILISILPTQKTNLFHPGTDPSKPGTLFVNMRKPERFRPLHSYYFPETDAPSKERSNASSIINSIEAKDPVLPENISCDELKATLVNYYYAMELTPANCSSSAECVLLGTDPDLGCELNFVTHEDIARDYKDAITTVRTALREKRCSVVASECSIENRYQAGIRGLKPRCGLVSSTCTGTPR